MNENPSSMTRRELLQAGLCGAAALGLGGLAATPARAAATTPASLVKPARSVIQIWLWGGPSHVDTFDPKPQAGTDTTGPFSQPLSTRTDGLQVCELMPEIAKQSHHYTVIRSMTHGINAHETASYLMQTGQQPGRLVSPNVGAVVSLFKGVDHGYTGLVPPYVVLTQAQGRFSEAGFLGQKYKPFCTGGDPNAERFVVEGLVAPGVSDERQLQRRELLVELDTLGNAMPKNLAFQQHDAAEEGAYELMFGEARRLFDLNTEPAEVRERYGRTSFGQSCLAARRLVEAGVPYVTINYKGWDTHKQHFETMRRRLPEMDKAVASLLQDLASSGLLETTILWWGGEFGRTPRVQWQPPWNGGRGHFGKCFSVMLAGGGFAGGHVVGSSDDDGAEVKERPVYPRDLIGSIYSRMGIDPDGPLPNPRGMDLTVLPAPDPAQADGGLLREIMPS